METQNIIQLLTNIERLLEEQNILKKEILNFSETCLYLNVSESHLYKLTSRKEIPHFCPQGKKLYFKRSELEIWLQRNRQSTNEEVEQQAADYIVRKK